ncbi:hypothetical protein lerEdw1_020909 [Lerista edwardsae]|nr:hypothetical protein lerEdw1_020909 [Lerista edwardsae]
MKSGMLLLHFILPHFATAAFPKDPRPINLVPDEVALKFPVFLGEESEGSSPEGNQLNICLLRVIDNSLYVGARNTLYSVDLQTPHTDGIYYSKEFQTQNECYNCFKVLVKRDDETLLICGTNAYNPICRNYKIDTLEQDGADIKGHGRCPYHPEAENFALYSGGNLYTATTSDFMGIDAVIYRSLGETPYLRTAKQNSKWLKEPQFVHAIDFGDYIYFFFREISVEYLGVEKVYVSRVGRVCKNDKGGNMAVLDKHWTSFMKARLACTIEGDSPFHFNILQSVTDIVTVDGMSIFLAVFTTSEHSIAGSAVCAYNMEDVDKVFAGKFKEQKTYHSIWTPVPDANVPTPRPGACAGSGPLAEYASSSDIPDDTLRFIKTHPLMHETVNSLNKDPWFHKTLIRCDYNGESFKRIVDLRLDKQHGALYVAFPHCLVRAPLGNCERYRTCKKACIAARDPYCGWLDGQCVQYLPGAEGEFEQDIKHGNTDGMDDC